MSDELDQVYRERNELAATLASLVDPRLAWKGADPDEPGWPVLYIELHEGQVSWHFSPEDAHMLRHVRNGEPEQEWDGHSQADRSERLERYWGKMR